MTRVPSRQLRNETRSVLARVEAGEDVVITVGGRDVAVLSPLPTRRRWVDTRAFLKELQGVKADADLARELDELNPGTTDELDEPG